MSSALNDEIEKDVLPWLRLAEDLRLLELDVELNMPQICVMGDQSSGKSSVLEALSGIPFPRGTGLVTRCPIRMVMKRARPGEMWSAFVSTSINPAPVAVKDIAELNTVMNQLTQELCGGGSNSFSTESIIVDLTSPDACDLTVVDLPGIIRTVTAGQSVSVIEQVNRLIKSYLADQRTIILAVIPANQDIATVDILERAQGVDPTGERTIGVLTKTDLIGPGNEEEVLAVVNNIRKPLTLGYVMVKNRSQREIAEKMSTARSREMEAAFFANHAHFRSCNPKLLGVGQLSKKLTQLLVGRIKGGLSPMKQSVEGQLGDLRAQLRLVPSSYASTKTSADRQKLLVSITQEYVRHLTDCIRGEYRDRIMVRHPELRMYTLAVRRFEDFQQTVNECAPAFKEPEFATHLAAQIEQLRGRELPGFMSSQAFYMCMARYVDDWAAPMARLVADVQAVALEVAASLADVLFAQYPGLRSSLRAVTETILRQLADSTSAKLTEVMSREKDPFTLNDFLQQWVNKLKFDRFSAAVDSAFDEATNPASNWNGLKEEVFVGLRHWYRSTHSVSAAASSQDMTAIMEAYWHLSAKRFVDNCCMAADKQILGQLPLQVQDHMYTFIRDDAALQALFSEDPELADKRLAMESRRDRLVQAAAKLASIVVPAPPAPPTPPIFNSLANSGTSAHNKDVSGPNGVSARPGELAAAPVATGGTFSANVSVAGKVGIGLVLSTDSTDPTKLVIKGFQPLPGVPVNPCLAAGLQVGDKLVAINGEPYSQPGEAVGRLKGVKGPTVNLTVYRR